jgi:hypothetical protein
MSSNNSLTSKLSRDIFWIVFSVVIGLIIVNSDVVTQLLMGTEKNKIIGSFVTGIFFTSIFTIAPAGLALAKIAHETSFLTVILVGALGATIGDFLIFLFIRNSFTKDIQEWASHSSSERLQKLLTYKPTKLFRPLVGAIVFVSPLPDEMGLTLLGLSNVPTLFMLPITFVLNIISVSLLCLISGALF